MVNLSRAKDAAIAIALSDLNALDHRQAAGPATKKSFALPDKNDDSAICSGSRVDLAA